MDDGADQHRNLLSSLETMVEEMSLLFAPETTATPNTKHGSDASAKPYSRKLRNSPKVSWLNSLCKQLVLKNLAKMEWGRLMLVDDNESFEFGSVGQSTQIQILDQSFYREVVCRGGIGAAEAYIRGYWDSPDLVTAMQFFARNTQTRTRFEQQGVRLLAPVRSSVGWLRRNTRTGSRRNISAHYDLSNDFFALMLDPTMTYSSGIFSSSEASLEDASIEKYDRICRSLALRPQDHVLEIGTGWGGFAEHAAAHYGCRVTTTTISKQQFKYAARRFKKPSLRGQVELRMDDYRDLTGSFDKLVSIEMIEAVGHNYLRKFFASCSALLKPDGMMALQAITIPDHRYQRYRRSTDFIQEYIFPGGHLPSFGAICHCLGNSTDFRLLQSDDFGMDYATTLAHWRHNFWKRIEDVKALGFDDRFIRTWNYYLSYCEAGFRERQIGVSQIFLAKPGNRQVLPTGR